MEIKSLSNVNFESIFKSFSQAFDDYEIQLNKVQLQTMLNRRGFIPELSFAAFEEDTIVSFTLNGIGCFNGIPTAYDTGTGTIKDFRGKGLATKIFEYSIPYLKEKNIKQYLLEVLQHNTKAVSVYKNLGFEVTREFNYFVQKSNEIINELKNFTPQYIVRQTEMGALDSITDFWDFYPSWQNSMDAIHRKPDDFKVIGAFNSNKLIGYCIFEPNSGDITQIAVDKQTRRKRVASLLLREAIRLNSHDSIKVINTDIHCNSITGFLESKNIVLKGKQFEMIKKL